MHTADGPASLAPYLSPNPGQAFLLPVAETNYLPIRDFNVADPIVNAKAASLFDIRSGRWLYARNIDQKLPIASITKLMTAVVLLENLKLTEVFTVSAENINVDGTGADLQRGEELYGQDLFKIMLIKSSNDAALVLAAEARKRGVDVIQRMNEKARELGMLNTSFNDPSGLDDQGSFSTAADLVKLVSYASEFEEITDALKTPVIDVFSFDGRFSHHLINTNRLLGQVEGVVFGKTGYTDNALGTMALMVGVSGGEDRLISIVLGAHDRFGETSGLINWAKKAYRWR
ncbi:MAG: D-alanyl-D-alanine carboxypeptidase [Candidatus Yanofskybacteria bacterium]|nr:D-alanyl-D-alanine carboxypeptidase [Candidatus Yanofskybacteria bacterium]